MEGLNNLPAQSLADAVQIGDVAYAQMGEAAQAIHAVRVLLPHVNASDLTLEGAAAIPRRFTGSDVY